MSNYLENLKDSSVFAMFRISSIEILVILCFFCPGFATAERKNKTKNLAAIYCYRTVGIFNLKGV